MKHLTQQFVDEMKEKLLEEKERIELEITDISTHTELGSDMDSAAQEIQIDQVNQDILAHLKKDLEKIEIALRNIEAGTYGLDSEGNEISEARLQVIPWADTAA